MVQVNNPFITAGYISPEYFCDRQSESNELIKQLTNGNNLALISPRRMGKTGLVMHCFAHSEISDKYYTFFVDIYATKSLRDFILSLSKVILERLKPFGRKAIETFVNCVKTLQAGISFDVVGNPSFNMQLGDVRDTRATLDEIFKYLEVADKPCIVAIDEFQQIGKYPEKNIEALLRTHIQKIENSHFIFAGSERSMMQAMFLSSARPFYRSSDVMELEAINKDIYVAFIAEHFEHRDRRINTEDIEKVYDFFKGHTFYIQKTFNESFADTPVGSECTLGIIRNAINSMIDYNDTIFREILSNIPENQKKVLYAIAKEGDAMQILSASFIKRHSLASASSIQAATKKLLEKDIITEVNKVYSVTDKLFAMWINRLYGKSKILF